MEYIIVGIGGILGSLLRYTLGRVISNRYSDRFPYGTFVINATGAFLLGIVSKARIDNSLYLFLGDGFLGAYTTFSTFMYEGFKLFNNSKYLNAFIYIVLTVILGILGFLLGSNLVENFI